MSQILFKSSTIAEGNMSFRRGDEKEALQNRLKFFKKYNLDYENSVGIAPTHTTNVTRVTFFDKGKMLDETDGIITDDPTITLFTLTGDCIPLALIDPNKKVFALVHISWKNTDKGILTQTISNLIQTFHSSPQDLIAKFGPSIGPCCYHQTNPTQLKNQKWKPFIKALDETYTINLWSFVENELITLGLQNSNIDNPKICTYHSSNYFSHHKAMKEKLEHDYRFGTILTTK